MNLSVIFIVLFVLIIFSLILYYIFFTKRYINLFDEKSSDKLQEFNYKSLEIKRKRRAQRLVVNVFPYSEHPLEQEYPTPWSTPPAEDVIEVYGTEENNNKHLIFKIHWTRENAQKVKEIVNDLNKKILNI